MLRALPVVVVVATRPSSASLLSQTTRGFLTGPNVRSLKFVRKLEAETQEPLWRLLRSLTQAKNNNAPLLALSDTLAESKVTVAVFRSLTPLLSCSNIESALQRSPQLPLPPWMIMYLACFKIRTPSHANGPLMDVVFSHMPHMPDDLKPPLLIMTAVALARFGLLHPLRHVVTEFLTIPIPTHASLHFNLLLQATSTLRTSSVEAANLVVKILDAMETRQIELYLQTYKSLLADRFVTLQLTVHLRDKMAREGVTPSLSHLEAYLRVFAKHGAIHDAKAYANEIKTYLAQSGFASLPPSSIMLASKGDRASAFHYLANLLKPSHPTPKPHPPPHSRHPPAKPKPPSHSRLPWKHTLDIHDWTTALSIASSDRSTSVSQLIRLFEKYPTQFPAFRPNIYTYTVLIRGLLKRRVWLLADKYWNALLQTGLTMDGKALTVGLQTLVRVGKPHVAIATLEAFAGRIDVDLPISTPASSSHHRRKKIQNPVLLDPIIMNELFVALLRIARPDIIFLLWDHMSALYGVLPNHTTLDIMLRAARMATKMDDSVQGTLALARLRLRLNNPFRRRRIQEQIPQRADVIKKLETLAGTIQSGVRKYRSGIWNEKPAYEEARRVFLDILVGNYPGIADVRSPVSYDGVDPTAILPSTPSSLDPGIQPNVATGSSIRPPPSRTRYPQLMLTDSNFQSYILLLCISPSPSSPSVSSHYLPTGYEDYEAEIPLVLAWMRQIDVRPSIGTLALALGAYAEVGVRVGGVRGPLMGGMGAWGASGEGETNGDAAVSGNSPYERLVRWLEGWVGVKGMPNRHEMQRWRGVLGRVRERRERRV